MQANRAEQKPCASFKHKRVEIIQFEHTHFLKLVFLSARSLFFPLFIAPQ